MFYLLLLAALFLTAPAVRCYVDECDSLMPEGLRKHTENLTLDFSIVDPIADAFRFRRNVTDDGFVRYVSETGFLHGTISGFAYFGVDWRLEVRTGDLTATQLDTTFVLDPSNVEVYREEWENTPNTTTRFNRFEVELPDMFGDCPKAK